MSFVILAIRPHHPVQAITRRPTERMAKFIAERFAEESNNKIKTKVVPAGSVFCNQCGKCDNWESSTECKNPAGNGDEWACRLGLDGYSKGVTA